MAIMSFLRSAINKLTPKNNIERQLHISVSTSGVMERAIDLWNCMYANNPPWRGGPAEIIPLNLPAAIAEEMARLILTEFEIKVSGSARGDYINKQIEDNFSSLSDHVELYCAKGGICLKPYVSGRTINIDFTQADRFFPTSYNSNKDISGGIFIDTKRQGDYLYTRLEQHSLVGTDYTINNYAFRSEKLNFQVLDDDCLSVTVQNQFMTPVQLTEVDDWAGLSETVTIHNIEHPLFVYIKVPRANTIDTYSPLGASVFSRAVEVIEQADRQFSRILWEYFATEAAIHASEDIFDTGIDGKPILPEGKERLYRAFDFEIKEAGSGSFLKEFAPEIRDNSLFSGLNKYFQRIEFLCGLSYGTISDPQQIEKTAEEIRTSKQRSFTVVSRMQSAWDVGLDRLIYAMDVLCTLYGLAPEGKAEKAVTWGDGVLEDTNMEYQRRWSMVMAGKYKLEKFYAWYFGCTEDEALELIPNTGMPTPPGGGSGNRGNYPPEE